MKKFWLVFKNEYSRQVLRKRFLFGVLSMPLFVLAMGAVAVGSVFLSIDTTPVAYVDESDFLADPLLPTQEDESPFSIPLVAIDSVEEAQRALDEGTIQAYYLINEDYPQNREVKVIAHEASDEVAYGAMENLLRINLLRNQTIELRERLLEGPQFTYRSLENGRQLQESNWVGIMIPIIAGILFIIAVNTSGGYLLQAVVEEKENRTMEIVITSVSPNQLMIGKILADLCVGLTQLGIWILFVIIALSGASFLYPDQVGNMLDPTALILMLVTLFPAFVMVAAIMATVGATATELREAQQIASMFTLPIVVPFWFVGSIMENPNGPVAIGLSLFPLTAPMALPLRAAFTNVPVWQVLLTIVLLLAVAAGALWLAGRAFRMGMLRYGKRLSWRELFGRPAKEARLA